MQNKYHFFCFSYRKCLNFSLTLRSIYTQKQ